ncbi:hypothetical protein [uncultured Shewanella sp.]|uniref:hypothetical protein n=1 Tax=uncultured Shewanella sp. TaxID=173975 RepID=UPI00260F37B5|nr:hypothetical protein [uncultured Shewanella sp.]
MNINVLLNYKLQEVRSSLITVDEFCQWVKAHAKELKNGLSSGVFLEMKLGKVMLMMDYLSKSLKDCLKCVAIHTDGQFIDRVEFNQCDDAMEALILEGVFRRIKEPCWFEEPSNILAFSGFYECISCGAIWKLTSPEREYTGGWFRIA